ncbi:MAG: hypothetical protein ACSLE6_00500 [Mycobacterium sp.]
MGARIFAADSSGANWTEYTYGNAEAVRFSAPDLKRAQRLRPSIRADEHADAVLDVLVAVAPDFRSACRVMAAAPVDDATLRYAGTLDGLAGLVSDIEAAAVADGVTLIPVSPEHDPGWLAVEVLRLLSVRAQARAS